MRPKGMEGLAAFSIREVMKVGAEEREKDKFTLQKNSESRSKKQSYPSKLSEN